MTLAEIALSLFFTMNSIGNMPVIIAILSRYETKKQVFIIIREMLIGLAILLLFGFFGLKGLNFLNIHQSVMGIAGGIILFLLALNMMFPKPQKPDKVYHEPFIVPIAIPIIVGPGTLAMMAVFFNQTPQSSIVIFAAFLAWIATTTVLVASCFVKKIIPDNILIAIEKLMGMILTFIAVQMAISAIIRYV